MEKDERYEYMLKLEVELKEALNALIVKLNSPGQNRA